jgi:hypothetical protein
MRGDPHVHGSSCHGTAAAADLFKNGRCHGGSFAEQSRVCGFTDGYGAGPGRSAANSAVGLPLPGRTGRALLPEPGTHRKNAAAFIDKYRTRFKFSITSVQVLIQGDLPCLPVRISSNY